MTAVPLGPGPEFDRIRAIARGLGSAGAGLGDDCAFLPAGPDQLAISVDTAVEGVHFRRDWLEPEEIGWRAASAALSDLAAVGARVEGVLVGLSAPRSEPADTLTRLMRGVGDATAAVGGRVLGGDLTGSDRLVLAVTVVGRAGRPVLRSGALPGDRLWVTGSLGGARAALVRWEAGATPTADSRQRFARPEPRIAAGLWLNAMGATAMLDLSDGLAGDAPHLAAASGVALDIDLRQVPVGPGVAEAVGPLGDPFEFAAKGGEDYELLVAMPAGWMPDGSEPVALTPIGVVLAGSETRFVTDGVARSLAGFDHFR